MKHLIYCLCTWSIKGISIIRICKCSAFSCFVLFILFHCSGLQCEWLKMKIYHRFIKGTYGRQTWHILLMESIRTFDSVYIPKCHKYNSLFTLWKRLCCWLILIYFGSTTFKLMSIVIWRHDSRNTTYCKKK